MADKQVIKFVIELSVVEILEYAMLPKRPLHLVVHVPPTRQVLRLHVLHKVPPPHPDEILQSRVVPACALAENGLDNLLTVRIDLLAIAEPEWLELLRTAVID